MSMKAWIAALFFAAALTAGTSPAGAAQAQRVVLAGGCFWGMQLVFGSLNGVEKTVAGYAGGGAATAHYDDVSTGTTGHAESVEITYDPARISFQRLLDVYFRIAHDPTQRDRQGPDVGSQYRSEIFYTDASQASAARAYIEALTRHHVFAAPIVTQLAPLRGFYPAEAEHQQFALHNPTNPYIVVNDIPKLHALRKAYPKLVKADAPNF